MNLRRLTKSTQGRQSKVRRAMLWPFLCALLLGSVSASATTFSYIGAASPQSFTVPEDGVYKIVAQGASGGNEPYTFGSDAKGGLGAVVTGEFSLTANLILYITVGGRGSNGSSDLGIYGAGGGGGATLVASENAGAALIIAGGGGGAGAGSGKNGLSATSTSASAGEGSGGAAGTDAYGGAGGGKDGGGGGGQGYLGPGTDGSGSHYGHGGGTAVFAEGGENAGHGGFNGGGGGGGDEDGGGGGGGGYNGGGGGVDGNGGGAGGSLNASTLYTSFATASGQADGSVTITEMSGSGSPSSVPEPSSLVLIGSGVVMLSGRFCACRRSRRG